MQHDRRSLTTTCWRDYAFLRNIFPLNFDIGLVRLSAFVREKRYWVGDRPESFLKMRLNCDKDIHGSGMCLILVTRFS